MKQTVEIEILLVLRRDPEVNGLQACRDYRLVTTVMAIEWAIRGAFGTRYGRLCGQ